jgi:hypothetical protein
MKQKCIHMRCMALVAFLALCSFGFAQMPTGFPTMPNTGNPAADAATYEQAKTMWLANNPSVVVTSPAAPVVELTEAQNAAAQELKTAQAANAEFAAMPQAEQAARQLRQLRATFEQHQGEWETGNVRVYSAYIEALTMARGESTVTVSASDYATFFPELKSLVDANTALFTVTP